MLGSIICLIAWGRQEQHGSIFSDMGYCRRGVVKGKPDYIVMLISALQSVLGYLKVILKGFKMMI